MAKNNRTDAESQVNTILQATIDASEHRGLLNDQILNSIVFKKGVRNTQTPSAGLLNIDFDDADIVIVAVTENTSINFGSSNIEDGQTVYVIANKSSASYTISLLGVNDVSINNAFLTTYTKIIYKITKVDTSLYATVLNRTFNIASSGEVALGTNTNNYITPKTFADNIGDYVQDYLDNYVSVEYIFNSFGSNVVIYAGFDYMRMRARQGADGTVFVSGVVTINAGLILTLVTDLRSEFRTNFRVPFLASVISTGETLHGYITQSSGELRLTTSYSNSSTTQLAVNFSYGGGNYI